MGCANTSPPKSVACSPVRDDPLYCSFDAIGPTHPSTHAQLAKGSAASQAKVAKETFHIALPNMTWSHRTGEQGAKIRLVVPKSVAAPAVAPEDTGAYVFKSMIGSPFRAMTESGDAINLICEQRPSLSTFLEYVEILDEFMAQIAKCPGQFKKRVAALRAKMRPGARDDYRDGSVDVLFGNPQLLGHLQGLRSI